MKDNLPRTGITVQLFLRVFRCAGNLAIVSILGIVFSSLLIANPIITGISLVLLTSVAFIFVGINAIVLAFQLRKLKTLP